jgi:hypothetical protein
MPLIIAHVSRGSDVSPSSIYASPCGGDPSRNLKQRDGRNGNRPAAALYVPMAVL